MARFPFEEDGRFRFGDFHELVRRYLFIGRASPAERRPEGKAAMDRRSTPRGDRSRPPTQRRRPVAREFAIRVAVAAP